MPYRMINTNHESNRGTRSVTRHLQAGPVTYIDGNGNERTRDLPERDKVYSFNLDDYINNGVADITSPTDSFDIDYEDDNGETVQTVGNMVWVDEE